MPAILTIRDTNGIGARGVGLTAIAIIFSVLIIIFVGLRTVRTVKSRRVGLEDLLIWFATFLALGVNSILIASTVNGEGKHIQDISDSHRTLALYLPWLTEPLSAFSLLFSKASVGVVLYQIGLGRTFNILIITVIVISTIINTWAAIAIVTSCHPTLAVSNGDSRPCSVSGTAAIGTYVQGAINMLLDLSIVVLPEIFLRSVRLPRRDRMVLRVLLGFMVFATISAAVKTSQLPALFHSNDATWDSAPVSDASTIENAFSILAACLPGIHNLLSPWLYKSRNSTQGSYDYTSHSGTSRAIRISAQGNSAMEYQSPNSVLKAPSSPYFKSPESSVQRQRADEYDLNPEFDEYDDTTSRHFDDRINLVDMNGRSGQANRSSHLVHELQDGVERWSFVPSHAG